MKGGAGRGSRLVGESRCSENRGREDPGHSRDDPQDSAMGGGGGAVSRRASGLAAHAGGWVEGPLLTRETRRGPAEHGSCETQLCAFV